jgi:hypothetical protein
MGAGAHNRLIEALHNPEEVNPVRLLAGIPPAA